MEKTLWAEESFQLSHAAFASTLKVIDINVALAVVFFLVMLEREYLVFCESRFL